MSYEKQNFVKGQILKADHLNHMEDGIAAAAVGVQGPKGDKGDVGPQGPKGDKGDTGPAATLDPTLSVSGNAADAKATGDAVSQLREDIADVKYIGTTQEGAWDYTGLPVTVNPKQITFVEDADSPFADTPRYVLAGQNFFPYTQKFNKTSPINGITFEQTGRVMHISGTAKEGTFANAYWMNGDSLNFPFPDHVQPGDSITLHTAAAGTTLNTILLQMTIYNADGGQVLSKNHDCSKNQYASTTITLPDGAAYFRMDFKIQSADQTQAHDRYLVAAMYKSDEVVMQSDFVDGSVTDLSLFPVPAEQLHYEVTIRDYINIRMGEGESLTSESLGYLTPEMYGAIGDDYTDDSAALQACISDGIEKRLPVRCMRRYLSGAPVTVTGSGSDVEISSLRYTGTDAAIVMDCDSSRLRVRSLTSGGMGLRLSGSSVDVRHNEIELGMVSTASHCISLESPAYAVFQNSIRFRRLMAGGDGCFCITTEVLETRASYITENTFEGGQCRNADWAFYGIGGNSKFYNFQVESYIKGGYCFVGNANALVIGDRHAESMRDGEYPYLKIFSKTDTVSASAVTGQTALRYISPVGMRVNEIDVSGTAVLVSYDESDYRTALTSLASMGVIDCQIDYYGQTGENNAKHYNTFARRALIWGNVLIFQDIPYQRWNVTENLDLRTITEDTPSMPCVFDIACANCEIWLHPSYCYLGIHRFEVVQTGEYTAKIYDYYTGSCVFDGYSLGAGTFEVTTWCSGRNTSIDGTGMEWGVRKIG